MKKTTSSDPEAPRNSTRFLRKLSSHSPSSSKLSVYLLAIFVVLFVLFQIHSLETPPTSPWTLMHQWEKMVTNSCLSAFQDNKQQELKSMASKLRESITFLPLKDLRFANAAMKDHTWFMSSMYDTHEEGEVQYQKFPTESSKGRILCLKGHHTRDGSWNYYALAWPEALPQNATVLRGITFISYNHYDYHNIWHGLSAMMPFVAWHIKSQCAGPRRWILYHWGELRTIVAPWVKTLIEATFGGPQNFDGMHCDGESDGCDTNPVCFEEAVVMRHNEGGMSRLKRMEVYDLMRCSSRMYCEVGTREKGEQEIGMTMLMRDGGRSFKNATAVIGIFEKECRKMAGCRLTVAHSHNLTVCEQVKLMSSTDILISAHGAQLTNMILMDRNSSVMELFPKGWLKLAGVGQYVYHWLASWSGMNHEGAWRDPVGDPCPYPEDDRRCMSVFKNGRIGHNETYFSEWARNVLNGVKMRKAQQVSTNPVSGLCGCQ